VKDLREFAFSRWLPSEARKQSLSDVMDGFRGADRDAYNLARTIASAQGIKMPEYGAAKKPKKIDLAAKFRAFSHAHNLQWKARKK
jgi:hypothetical protein